MFCLETAGTTMREVTHAAGKMAEAHEICLDRYGYDGCVIDFDDASLAEACGARVIFRENEPAVVDESVPVIASLDEVESLRVPDPERDGRLPVWLEATHVLGERVGQRALIMGRADQGPFALACLLRGTQQFMMDILALEDQAPVHRLIDYCRRVCAVFAKAQKDAGAHVTSIGDSLAGPNLISPAHYRQFAFGPEKALIEEVQEYGIPMSLHICGNTSKIVADMGRTGARILEVDWKVDMQEARRVVPADTVLMGNVNPSDPLVFGTPEQVKAAALAVLEATGGSRLFLSSGCAMGRNTPPENLRALVSAAEQYGPPTGAIPIAAVAPAIKNRG
jgi:MtaA/CmuA family methyltransferase